jgi:hypothetical protein
LAKIKGSIRLKPVNKWLASAERCLALALRPAKDGQWFSVSSLGEGALID